MNQSAESAHPAFQSIRTQEIESLNLRVEQYEHIKTGAVHYHLASDNNENVFLVALRTVPKDSTGVAHILEHTALCGSERFPVRDPFFMMLRRSLNTFMNAFTSSDWTAYPFASQNRKDFDNLLQVYLDAVFFSRLDPLDFAQEGHRVEFAEPGDADSNLVFKGVVFNEMKGAMSSISSTLWQTLCRHLFSSSTYHYNSGGDPAKIPDLSYEELRAFYRSHYHPSNAIFMTFGDIEAAQHQAVFEEHALHSFKRLDEKIEVLPERRFQSPKRIDEVYAFDEDESTADKTHIVIAWLLGESTDLKQLLEAQLLSSVLIDNSASPLQHLLETTDLGRAPSPLCGLEDSMREMVFCCGIEGSEARHAEELEKKVLAVIEDIASNGVELSRLEAVLHQLELHQREVSGDGYPYGLQLILQALGSATHYSDPIAVLNLEPVIESLREKIQDPEYIKRLARELLLENSHRISLVMVPDRELSSRRQAQEEARLAGIKESMTAEQRAETISLADRLIARQHQQDDESILPRVELSDVPDTLPDLHYTQSSVGTTKLTTYARGTNGIGYQQIVSPLPHLTEEQLHFLPIYSSMLTELGIGHDSYLEAQHRQSATVGSINAFTSLRGDVDDEQEIKGFFTLSSKALTRNAQAQTQLMYELMNDVRFDEIDRQRDIVAQLLARREQSITGNGHSLAIMAACAGMSPLARLSHQQSGLLGIKRLRKLSESLSEPKGRAQFSASLANLHMAIRGAPIQHLAVADEPHLDPLVTALDTVWANQTNPEISNEFSLEPIRERRGELWLTNSQVNFCARAFPTVPVNHRDAPALTVLGGFLRNGFLHRAIREQGGAYGAGASQDSSIGAFRFYSYRDPRIEETLSDFDESVMWLFETEHEQRALEEAILGVISSIDKPSSPAGEAKQHYHNRLFGRTHEHRERFRQEVLDVTLDDLMGVAQRYLNSKRVSTAIVAPASFKDRAGGLAERHNLQLRVL